MSKKEVFAKPVNSKRKKNDFVSEKDAKDLSHSNKQIKPNKANVSPYGNHRHIIIVPNNVDKTYYMFEKVFEKVGNKRHIQTITRSPSRYPNYKTDVEAKPIDKYKGSVVIFEKMLGARYSSQL